jgi:hypothetical protein
MIVSISCPLLAYTEAQAQNPRVGLIVGNIDGISHDGEQFYISGWACQQGRKDSIQIHIYAAAPGGPSKRVFVTANKANFDSEPAVGRECQDNEGGKHRFLVALPFEYSDKNTFFVNGIRVVDGVPNDVIAGSGKPLHHFDASEMPFRTATVLLRSTNAETHRDA